MPFSNLPAVQRSSDRREFLKKSLAGTILLGSAAFLTECRRRAAPASESPRPAGLAVLDAAQFRTLTAFSQAILPGPAPDPAVAAVPHRIDQEIGFWSAKNQGQIQSLLALIEHGTRYFVFSWRSFSALSIAERQAYLRGWESSWFGFRRQAFQALRMMVFFYYYSQDGTWKSIGYDGPWEKPSGDRMIELSGR